jgi:predicted extracellular nuclease
LLGIRGYHAFAEPPMTPRCSRSSIVVVFFAISLVSLICQHARAQASGIVISQIYGGGGNSGATLRNDFVELFNSGGSPIDITGWTIQYASASGTSWDSTVLNGQIQPGQHYLIQEGGGSGGSVSLPTPDAVGGINFSAASAKVALVSSTALLQGLAPVGAGIVDLVGYGSANFAEGNPASGLSNTTALIRGASGCQDTG